MQLAVPPEVLAPLGAGMVVVAAVLVAFLLSRRRRRHADVAPAAAVAQLGAAPDPEPSPAESPPAEPQPAQVGVADPAEIDVPPRSEAPPSPWREPERIDRPPKRVGSGRTAAAAVAKALAARDERAQAAGGPGAPITGRRGDARDRLLAVLLDDPVPAVGAAAELEDCRCQLERLSAAVRREQSARADLLARLSASGLRPEQLARLSGLSADEVCRLLPATGASSPATRRCG